MKYVFFLLLIPFVGTAQKKNPLPSSFEGVWAGQMYNDTTRTSTELELAIGEKGKKYNGFSYTVFLVDGKKNIGIKSIKVKSAAQGISVEDEKLLDDNYDAPAAKGVRTFFDLRYEKTDSNETLSGKWRTNITREYNSVTGTVFLIKQKMPHETAIIPRLQQLNLAGQLSFMHSGNTVSPDVAAQKQSLENQDIATLSDRQKRGEKERVETIVPDTTIVNPEITIFMFPKTENEKRETDVADAKKSNKATQADSLTGRSSDNVKQQNAVRNKIDSSLQILAKSETTSPKKPDDKQNLNTYLSKGKNDVLQNRVPSVVETNQGALQKENKESAKTNAADISGKSTLAQKPDAVKGDNKDLQSLTEKAISASDKIDAVNQSAKSKVNPAEKNPVHTSEDKAPRFNTAQSAASLLSTREIETIRTVEIAQDTLIFSLFDNGIIDGDTVSVLVNDRVVMSKIGLRAQAYNDTIYLHPDMGDSIKIILYAENLGSIPPNTGLLVIRERGKNHEIRFSGDLKKNSAIILKRKRSN